uniref:Uncharacterized protein n=1 Tax=Daphnia galeata TaxID=27404 RepID=A0A8J2RBF7_9CRUS|nr:unnamed protein product [Daphnia galeata]
MVIDPWGTVIAKMSRRDEFGISCSRFGIFEKSATRNTRFHSPPTRRLPITHLCFSYFTAATRRGYILFRSGEFQRMGSVLPESTCTLWLLSTVNASFLDVRNLLVMLLKPTRRIPDMQPDELADLFLTAQRVQRGMELFPLRFFVERCRLRRSRCRAKHSS